MSSRTILVIILTIALTLFFIYNDQIIEINLLANTIRISKAVLLPSITLIGLAMGYALGHYSPTNRKRKKELKSALKQIESQKKSSDPSGKLSDEDRNYIQ